MRSETAFGHMPRGVAGVGRKLAGGDRPVFVADGVAACHMDPDRELKR